MQRNGGPSVARNAAIDAASGTWLAILDADDAFASTRLAKLIPFAVETGADLVADDLAYYDAAAGCVTGRGMGDEAAASKGLVSLRDFLAHNLASGEGLDWGLLKPIFRRSTLLEHGIRYEPDMRHGEDFRLVVELLCRGAQFRLLNSTALSLYAAPRCCQRSFIGNDTDHYRLSRTQGCRFGFEPRSASGIRHGTRSAFAAQGSWSRSARRRTLHLKCTPLRRLMADCGAQRPRPFLLSLHAAAYRPCGSATRLRIRPSPQPIKGFRMRNLFAAVLCIGIGGSAARAAALHDLLPILWGVSESGLEFGKGTKAGTNFAVPDPAYYLQHGVRLIRLPFKIARLQPQAQGPFDPKFLGYLKKITAEDHAGGAITVLDPHGYGFMDANGKPRDILADPAAATDYVEFMRRLAEAFVT